jgi:hypothetical protein
MADAKAEAPRRGRSRGDPGGALEIREPLRKSRKICEVAVPPGGAAPSNHSQEHIDALQNTILLQGKTTALSNEVLVHSMNSIAALHVQIAKTAEDMKERETIAQNNVGALQGTIGEMTTALREARTTIASLEREATSSKADASVLREAVETLETQSLTQKSDIVSLRDQIASLEKNDPLAERCAQNVILRHRGCLEVHDIDNAFDARRTPYCELADSMIKEGTARQGERASITALRNAGLITYAVRRIAESDKELKATREQNEGVHRSNAARLKKINAQTGLIGRLKHAQKQFENASVGREKDWERDWSISIKKRNELQNLYDVAAPRSAELAKAEKLIASHREESRGKDAINAELAMSNAAFRILMAKQFPNVRSLPMIQNIALP